MLGGLESAAGAVATIKRSGSSRRILFMLFVVGLVVFSMPRLVIRSFSEGQLKFDFPRYRFGLQLHCRNS